jgi:hypothetical protein
MSFDATPESPAYDGVPIPAPGVPIYGFVARGVNHHEGRFASEGRPSVPLSEAIDGIAALTAREPVRVTEQVHTRRFR